jgi:hypothetical protein
MKNKYTWGYGYYPHWACEICIVRAMCQDDGCYMTECLHKLCLDCKVNHICTMDKDCKNIEKYKLWESIGNRFGDQIYEHMRKHLKETSIYYRFMTPNQNEQTDITWWTPED